MRFVLATFASYLVMAVLATILFGWVLSAPFEPVRAMFRPADELAETVIWAYLAQFARVFIFTGILIFLHGRERPTLRLGAIYGFLMGLFAGTFHVANSASLPLPAETAAAWVAFDTALLTVGGIVFALSYRPR